jgi:hypothetical protein
VPLGKTPFFLIKKNRDQRYFFLVNHHHPLLLYRKLCSKLYFKAEAQQIDRILESFAKRYWACNPKSIFGSVGKVLLFNYNVVSPIRLFNKNNVPQ